MGNAPLYLCLTASLLLNFLLFLPPQLKANSGLLEPKEDCLCPRCPPPPPPPAPQAPPLTTAPQPAQAPAGLGGGSVATRVLAYYDEATFTLFDPAGRQNIEERYCGYVANEKAKAVRSSFASEQEVNKRFRTYEDRYLLDTLLRTMARVADHPNQRAAPRGVAPPPIDLPKMEEATQGYYRQRPELTNPCPWDSFRGLLGGSGGGAKGARGGAGEGVEVLPDRLRMRRVMWVGVEKYSLVDVFTLLHDLGVLTLTNDAGNHWQYLWNPLLHLPVPFQETGEHVAPGSLDVVFIHGVFGWGIDSPSQQNASVATLARLLRPGGMAWVTHNEPQHRFHMHYPLFREHGLVWATWGGLPPHSCFHKRISRSHSFQYCADIFVKTQTTGG